MGAGSCGPWEHGTPGCLPGEEPTGVSSAHPRHIQPRRCRMRPSLTSLPLRAGVRLGAGCSGDVPTLSPRHLLTRGRILLRSHPLPGREQDPGGTGDGGDRQPLRSLPAGVSPAGGGMLQPLAPALLVGPILTLPSHLAGFTALKGRGSPGVGACPALPPPAAPRGAKVGAQAGGVTPLLWVPKEPMPASAPGTPQDVSPLRWGVMSCWDVAAENVSTCDTSGFCFPGGQPCSGAPEKMGFHPSKTPLWG